MEDAPWTRKSLSLPPPCFMLDTNKRPNSVQPAILTLLEIHAQCPEVLSRIEIYVDGGLSRGADILKALALGATAVGIGRPFLYSLAYGQEGVEHLIQIYKDELECAMKLSGLTDLDQAHPGMVNTAGVEVEIRRGDEHPWIRWMPGRRAARL
jgi:L-lactate dehydrogenase (cytochrome)